MKKLMVAALLASSAFVSADANAAFINGGVGFTGSVLLGTSIPAPGPTAVVSLLTFLDLDTDSLASGSSGDLSPVGGLTTTGNVNLGAPLALLFSADGFDFTLQSVSNIVRSPGLTFGTPDASGNRTAQDTLTFDIAGSVIGGAFVATGFTGSFVVSGSCRDVGSDGSCDDFQVATWAATLTATGAEPPPPPPPPPTDVPAPASLALMGAALAGLSLARRRR